MHPLLDRHDLTAQRRATTGVPESERAELQAVAAELAQTNALLRGLLVNQRADLVHLCVTDREPAEFLMDNFPVPGSRRLIVRRAGAGGTFSLAASTPTLVCAANENRLGGTIVNAGAGTVTLFGSVDLLEPGTATPLSGGAPQWFLVANGGSWDYRFGTMLWCGNVLAVAGAGGTTVTVAEF